MEPETTRMSDMEEEEYYDDGDEYGLVRALLAYPPTPDFSS